VQPEEGHSRSPLAALPLELVAALVSQQEFLMELTVDYWSWRLALPRQEQEARQL
jgi:hypothetical protein